MADGFIIARGGHAKVTDTYWYITATPELMAIAARRLEPLAPTGGGL